MILRHATHKYFNIQTFLFIHVYKYIIYYNINMYLYTNLYCVEIETNKTNNNDYSLIHIICKYQRVPYRTASQQILT